MLAASTGALYPRAPVELAVSFSRLGEVPGPIELLGGVVSVFGVVLINRARLGGPVPRESKPVISAESAASNMSGSG